MAFSLGTLVLMIVLLLNILRLRLGLMARRKHEREFLQDWQPVLAAAITGDTAETPPLPAKDLLLFLRLWNHLHESVRGGARHKLNIIALRLNILEQLWPLLQHRNRGFKLIALTTLGNLQAYNDWSIILAYARQPDPVLSLTAAHTLFQIDPDETLAGLKKELLDRVDWPAAHLAVLIKDAGTPAVYTSLIDTAMKLAVSANPDDRPRLLRLLYILQPGPYPLMIHGIRTILSRTRDDEVVAQCLKFLHEPEDLPQARGHLAHANWVVRLQAARALGRFGTAEDIPRLSSLLTDPVWWVRYRTAQALMALTRGDADAWAKVCGDQTDRFAQDILSMAAAEKARG
jgi:hypothetical protein